MSACSVSPALTADTLGSRSSIHLFEIRVLVGGKFERVDAVAHQTDLFGADADRYASLSPCTAVRTFPMDNRRTNKPMAGKMKYRHGIPALMR